MKYQGEPMTASLINPDGDVIKKWHTDSPYLAYMADRNYPAGWSVVVDGD